jgi:hypothetical protein
MGSFLADDLLTVPLASVVKQHTRFWDMAVTQSAASCNSHSSAVALSSEVSNQFPKLLAVAGESKSLRILAQLSAILSCVPIAAPLDDVRAYTAACFLIAFELVSSLDDPKLPLMKSFVKSISNNSGRINGCMARLLTWMGQS